MLVPSDVNGVVVDRSVRHGTGYIDAARVIVLADVVADNRPNVPNVLTRVVAAFVADQQESAVVVVTVVVLDDGVAAVPVRIETFAIPLPVRAVNFVELHHRVVGAPRPDAGIVAFRSLIRATHDIPLDKR